MGTFLTASFILCSSPINSEVPSLALSWENEVTAGLLRWGFLVELWYLDVRRDPPCSQPDGGSGYVAGPAHYLQSF